MEATATDMKAVVKEPVIGRRLIGLFGLLGFSSGLPFLLFSSVLFLRLTNNGASLGVVAFFAWVSLLPTFKFAWAPMLDRLTIPGFGRAWGRWRSWILLSQLGVVVSLIGLAFANPDQNLSATALWALQLAFWATTLEAASDGWRCELAHDAKSQAPLVSAVLWGYRSAMVAAGSIAVLLAGVSNWGTAYFVIAAAAFVAFPLVLATKPENADERAGALMAGIGVSGLVFAAGLIVTAIVGFAVIRAAAGLGITPESHVTRVALLLCGLPFVIMMIGIPRIRRLPEDSAFLASPAFGPYLDFFRGLGYAAVGILAFVSIYRMGDVLTLTLAKPLMSSLGYSLTQIGIADGALSLVANIIGVGIGAWAAARLGKNASLALGAVFAAFGNAAYVWLANVPPSDVVIYAAAFADNFGNGMAAAVFVVYLSVLVNPKYPAAQYAFLAGFAFLLPRLLAGASASIQRDIGYDGFFALSGALSLTSILLLPFLRNDRKTVLLAAALVLGSPVAMAQSSSLEAALAKSTAAVEAAVADGRIPGAVMVVAVAGEVLTERAFGHAHLNDFGVKRLASPRTMETSTVFDVASITKVMATTMAIMILVDQGKVKVEAPVHTYLPDFRGPELDKITVRHLLAHTGGLVQWQPLYYQAATKAEAYQAIRKMPLQWPVGDSYHYSDLGFMLLGYIVERVSAKPLDAFINDALYAPLGFKSTGFLPKARGLWNFAATESGNGYERHMVYGPDFGYGYTGDPRSWDGWRRYVLEGEVNDGNAWYANEGVAGHAGLFSTAGELRVLLDLLLSRGVSAGRQFINGETVDLFLKPDAHLGWRQPDDMPKGAFAHTGFTGTYVLGVPEAKLAFVLLTNRQNAGADAKGYFTDLSPLQAAAVRPLLDALLPR